MYQQQHRLSVVPRGARSSIAAPNPRAIQQHLLEQSIRAARQKQPGTTGGVSDVAQHSGGHKKSGVPDPSETPVGVALAQYSSYAISVFLSFDHHRPPIAFIVHPETTGEEVIQWIIQRLAAPYKEQGKRLMVITADHHRKILAGQVAARKQREQREDALRAAALAKAPGAEGTATSGGGSRVGGTDLHLPPGVEATSIDFFYTAADGENVNENFAEPMTVEDFTLELCDCMGNATPADEAALMHPTASNSTNGSFASAEVGGNSFASALGSSFGGGAPQPHDSTIAGADESSPPKPVVTNKLDVILRRARSGGRVMDLSLPLRLLFPPSKNGTPDLMLLAKHKEEDGYCQLLELGGIASTFYSGLKRGELEVVVVPHKVDQQNREADGGAVSSMWQKGACVGAKDIERIIHALSDEDGDTEEERVLSPRSASQRVARRRQRLELLAGLTPEQRDGLNADLRREAGAAALILRREKRRQFYERYDRPPLAQSQLTRINSGVVTPSAAANLANTLTKSHETYDARVNLGQDQSTAGSTGTTNPGITGQGTMAVASGAQRRATASRELDDEAKKRRFALDADIEAKIQERERARVARVRARLQFDDVNYRQKKGEEAVVTKLDAEVQAERRRTTGKLDDEVNVRRQAAAVKQNVNVLERYEDFHNQRKQAERTQRLDRQAKDIAWIAEFKAKKEDPVEWRIE